MDNIYNILNHKGLKGFTIFISTLYIFYIIIPFILFFFMRSTSYDKYMYGQLKNISILSEFVLIARL